MGAKSSLVNILGYILIIIFVRWVYVKFVNKVNLQKLVSQLNGKGWRMFGSMSCPWCKKQLALFGDYSKDISVVDCAANPDLCAKFKISGFPTWVDSQGNTYPGYKSPNVLMQMVL